MELGEKPSQSTQSRDAAWLSTFARNVASQSGEDGILEKLVELLPARTNWCVEFGAWDGQHLPNTYNLIENHGFSGVLIEASAERCAALRGKHQGNDRIHAVNAFVGWGQSDGLDAILARTRIPKAFDVLSIDIDGNDYHVWKAVESYRPRVVVIEFNPTIPTGVEFVQERDPSVMHGSSITSLVGLGREKGYELVAVTRFNGIFVDAEFYRLLGMTNNSVQTLRLDSSLVTHVFCGYDGTVFVRGHGRLPWHDIRYDERSMQLLPAALRKWRESYGPVRAKVFSLYRRVRSR